jgi:CHASE1-domain containing sensor protein
MIPQDRAIARARPPDVAIPPSRYVATIVAGLIGTAISFAAFFAVSGMEARLAELKLQEVSRSEAQAINSDLDHATGVLFTLRAEFSSADRVVGRAEFQAFAQSLRKRLVGLRNTGWAVRVTQEERDAFERSLREEGFPNFEIWERDAVGHRVRAGDRAEYFPILYPDPAELTPQILGFDIGSEALRGDALRRARSSGQPAATPPIKLITDEPDGFMSFIPVYGQGFAEHNAAPMLRGFMYGVFATAPMIENILAAKAIPTDVGIYFFDPNGPRDHRRIYWHAGDAASTLVPTEESLSAGPHSEGRIKVADQEWGAIFVPTTKLIGAIGSWQAMAVLATGLTITAMVVGYLLVSLKRTLRLEFLTASLRQTTQGLRVESEKVAQLARRDPMTGLANRTTFVEQLDLMFSQAKRDGRKFAVIYLDLDYFKDVNDTLGHPSGDLLLTIVADRLKALVRHSDVIARLGRKI